MATTTTSTSTTTNCKGPRADRVQLTAQTVATFRRVDIPAATTDMANKLLQENHETYHIYLDSRGFHNHIVHHILALWALRAPPADIRAAFDNNKDRQRLTNSADPAVVTDMANDAQLPKYLAQGKYWPDFLRFFQQQFDQFGWQNTVQRYLFAGDHLADDMLVRQLGGFLHPIIHVGYGIEFGQPLITAEGLAQGAVHTDYMRSLLLPAEAKAKERQGCGEKSRSIVELIHAIHDNQELKYSALWEDFNKLEQGVIQRTPAQIMELTSQWWVADPDELELRTAEMINAVCYYSAGAQRKDKAIKYDFYFMHCVNSSIFWGSFLRQPWIDKANKVRLLEWKVRTDLAMYASRKCPDLSLDDVKSYKPKQPSGWDGIHNRSTSIADDGHAAKLIRALSYGPIACAPFGDRPEFMIKQNDWLALGHMAIDSVEGVPEIDHWVRSAGFDEAWEVVAPRSQL